MDFKEENFPLYQLLIKNNEPGIENARRDFEAACKGGDEEKYKFVHGLQTIPVNVPWNQIPGATPEMYEQTLRACFAVYQDVASRGHKWAAVMVADYKRRGLGQSPKI